MLYNPQLFWSDSWIEEWILGGQVALFAKSFCPPLSYQERSLLPDLSESNASYVMLKNIITLNNTKFWHWGIAEQGGVSDWEWVNEKSFHFPVCCRTTGGFSGSAALSQGATVSHPPALYPLRWSSRFDNLLFLSPVFLHLFLPPEICEVYYLGWHLQESLQPGSYVRCEVCCTFIS